MFTQLYSAAAGNIDYNRGCIAHIDVQSITDRTIRILHGFKCSDCDYFQKSDIVPSNLILNLLRDALQLILQMPR